MQVQPDEKDGINNQLEVQIIDGNEIGAHSRTNLQQMYAYGHFFILELE